MKGEALFGVPCGRGKAAWGDGDAENTRARVSSLSMAGRSMIEMLGVLAIIGVLPAGGIMGYNQAMSAYTFNKFVKDVQTMVGAAVSVFPKPPTRTDRIQYYGARLNRLGILPDELYKTAPSPNSSLVKNPFTGKVEWKVILAESQQGQKSKTSNIGNLILPQTFETVFTFYNLFVPKKVCVKILTYDWNDIAPVWYNARNATYDFGYFIVKPLTVAEAETICNYDVRLYFFIHSANYIVE